MTKCEHWDAGWCYAPMMVKTNALGSGVCNLPEYCPYLKSQNKMKETDIAKVLIEGDTVTINGIKYKRVEEPKVKTLQQIIKECFDDKENIHTIPDIIDTIEKEWTPLNLNQKEKRGYTDGYSMGFDDALNLVRKTLR